MMDGTVESFWPGSTSSNLLSPCSDSHILPGYTVDGHTPCSPDLLLFPMGNDCRAMGSSVVGSSSILISWLSDICESSTKFEFGTRANSCVSAAAGMRYSVRRRLTSELAEFWDDTVPARNASTITSDFKIWDNIMDT